MSLKLGENFIKNLKENVFFIYFLNIEYESSFVRLHLYRMQAAGGSSQYTRVTDAYLTIAKVGLIQY